MNDYSKNQAKIKGNNEEEFFSSITVFVDNNGLIVCLIINFRIISDNSNAVNSRCIIKT